MQAVVIARLVTQQQWRRSGLLMPMTDRQELLQRWRKSFRLVYPFRPAAGDLGQPWIQTLAQLGHERRRWGGEVLILAASEVMPLHHDAAAECLAVGVNADQLIAFNRRQRLGSDRVTLLIQLFGELRPVPGRNSLFQILHL